MISSKKLELFHLKITIYRYLGTFLIFCNKLIKFNNFFFFLCNIDEQSTEVIRGRVFSVQTRYFFSVVNVARKFEYYGRVCPCQARYGQGPRVRDDGQGWFMINV